MRRNEILKYLNWFKEVVGFAGWRIKLLKQYKSVSSHAMVSVDIWKKEVQIELAKSFKKMSRTDQISILRHELTHGREELESKKLERIGDHIIAFEKEIKPYITPEIKKALTKLFVKFRDDEEEFKVNDLEFGYSFLLD